MGIIIALLLSLLMVVGFTIGCKPSETAKPEAPKPAAEAPAPAPEQPAPEKAAPAEKAAPKHHMIPTEPLEQK